MALKSGNIIQAKTGTLALTNTSDKALFTLPAQACVIGIRAFGTASNAAGTITISSRPNGSTTVTAFATIDSTATGPGTDTAATFSGIAFARQSDPVYVTGKRADASTSAVSTTGGTWSVVVEYL